MQWFRRCGRWWVCPPKRRGSEVGVACGGNGAASTPASLAGDDSLLRFEQACQSSALSNRHSVPTLRTPCQPPDRYACTRLSSIARSLRGGREMYLDNGVREEEQRLGAIHGRWRPRLNSDMKAAIHGRWCPRLQSDGREAALDSCRLSCPKTFEAFCRQKRSWLR